ncbi:MAG: CatB-related O-acetyltransferase [Merdimonas faecis]|uniref:CatB-related O-acetyltransferase n=1 Tax=Merdimonas faecis TaxID=1653435 RepID=UPI003990A38D
MRYIIREYVYMLIMLGHKIRSHHLKIGFRSKADKCARFEGYNKLSHHAYFSGEMGYASYIGANSVVIGKIGRFCSIAENVHFLTLTHPTQKFVSTHPCFYSLKKQSGFAFVKKQLFDEEPHLDNSKYSIIVGNDVYIGFGATIIGPCKIGDGAVIAAGAVVTKDVEPYEIVGGVPASRIKYRFSHETIIELMNLKWWEKDLEWIRQHSSEFESVEKLLSN